MEGIPQPPAIAPIVVSSSGKSSDFLSDIRKGIQLKRVPENMKHHRSGQIQKSVGGKPGGSQSADIRGTLTALLGGEPALAKSSNVPRLSQSLVDSPRLPDDASQPATSRAVSGALQNVTVNKSFKKSAYSLPIPPPPPVMNDQPIASPGSRKLTDLESRFTFPPESTLPSPPAAYNGTKTFVRHRPRSERGKPPNVHSIRA